MHLLGQLFIVQRPQVKFITAHMVFSGNGRKRESGQFYRLRRNCPSACATPGGLIPT
jgi:hypothetical protein